ncbi:MAG: exosortase-associated EpsI family protein [Fibrella sp.]|nr:exosortase-associated EpsI family protein [Armatimonadota bacterium]
MQKIRWSATVLALLFATTLAVAKVWNPPPPEPFVPISGAAIPDALAGYAAVPDAVTSVDDKARKALSTASIISRSYAPATPGKDAPSAPIEFILIGGTDRDALHDPRSCLIGSGWDIDTDRSEPLTVAGESIPAHYCHIVNPTLPGKPAYDMLYIYVVDGKVIESATQIRAQLLASALIGKKNTPVYYLRFIREADGGADGAKSGSPEDLRRFATTMWQALNLVKK